jgi:proline dehydrogenase
VRELNAKNILATLDHLGENTTNEREAIAAADEYLKILDAVAQTGVRSEDLAQAHPDGVGYQL